MLPIEQGEGDSFVAAFALATDAVASAIELQLEWGRGSWPFRVRLALHTGEVQTREGERYEGPTIIRCARLRSIAHGGQTVLSQTTHDLVVDHMPAPAWLDDMGVHHLKDIDRPEPVHQLRHPDLALNPAPLLWVAAGHLPVSLTSFVGREREIDTVLALMQANRIVSLLGVGGCGKTRLSVEVASRALPAFPDGVWFVELASIDEPDLTAQTVLATIGGREQPGRSATETILDALTGRTVLLVLDNCEHVVAATARVSSDLLSGAPTLSVLATSREQLGVAGEVTFASPEPLDRCRGSQAVRRPSLEGAARFRRHRRQHCRCQGDLPAARRDSPRRGARGRTNPCAQPTTDLRRPVRPLPVAVDGRPNSVAPLPEPPRIGRLELRPSQRRRARRRAEVVDLLRGIRS